MANCYTAIEQGLEVIPVLNKIDLPQAEPERVAGEIEDIIGLDVTDIHQVSAKTGLGVEGVLGLLVEQVPPPEGDDSSQLQALIIDSWFDNYLGIVSLVRVVEGRLNKGDKIIVKSTGKTHSVDQLGRFTPKRQPDKSLGAGEVGYVVAGIKDITGAPVGDTLVSAKSPDVPQLPGFSKVKPQVYAGLFPVTSDDFESFREALEKLVLNDASVLRARIIDALASVFVVVSGYVHMEIVQERLEREYGLDLITWHNRGL